MKLWVAVAGHNFKWVESKIILFNALTLTARGSTLVVRICRL